MEQEVKRLNTKVNQLETRYGLKGGYNTARNNGAGPITALEKRKW